MVTEQCLEIEAMINFIINELKCTRSLAYTNLKKLEFNLDYAISAIKYNITVENIELIMYRTNFDYREAIEYLIDYKGNLAMIFAELNDFR